MLASENMTKLRHVEEEKAAILAAQYRKLDELESRYTCLFIRY